jgi:predicted amidohydrolase YtcJ
MSDAKPCVEAFVVCGYRFGAVGSMGEARSWAGSDAWVIDLDGLAVCPGFIETHSHLSDVAMNLLRVDCGPEANKNIREILARLKSTSGRATTTGTSQ